MNHVVFHCHTDLSLLDSCSKFQEYLDLAVQQGMTALGCSEHGRISNWAANKLLCKKSGIKYLHACEVYLTPTLKDKVRGYHTVLIAKDRDGTIELNRLIKLSSDDRHYYYNPRLSFDEFFQISSHVIKTSACLASPLNKISNSEDIYMKLVRAYDYLEVQHHADENQRQFNKRLLRLSAQTGIPLIAGTDTHASSRYKNECRDILMLRKEQFYPGEENFDLVWRSTDELIEAYEQQGALPRSAYTEAIANTQRMADSVVDWELDTSIKYPILYGSREADTQKLIELCDIRLEEKLKSGAIPRSEEEAYRIAIKEELAVYEKLQMSGFILSEAEIIHWCRTNNIAIGPARGSVSGSRVAYVTDIIDFDPERWGTVFSRFANANRVEPGDIDTDCTDADRPAIFSYIREKFGEDYTARVASYGTVQDLSFIDDCGGGLALKWERENHPEKFKENGRLDTSAGKKADIFDRKNPYHPIKLEKIKSQFKIKPDDTKLEYPDLFYYYDGMIGTRISQSVHPAGMVISPLVLSDEYGVFWKEGELCLTLDMDILHDVGAIKYDMLILKGIAVIRDAYALMGKPYPRMYEIDYDDQDVWKDMGDDPSGIFQFESPFAAESVAKFKPKSLFDLSMLNAALRPSGASYRDDLIAHKMHKNPSKQIDDLLKDNNGFLIYQCDILSFLQQICGLSGSDADSVRRGIAKKKMEILEKWMPTILEGYCSHSDKPRAEAEEECKEYLKIIEDASSYMFSKNHSLPYSMIGYIFAYLKHYHPAQFVASYLMNAANDDDINTGRAMAKARGVAITKPVFRHDNRTFYISEDGASISDALSSIKGVGLKDAEALYDLRDFRGCFVELLREMTTYPGALNKTVIEKLIKIDYFHEFGCIKKLLDIYTMFQSKFKTTHVPATQERNMEMLRAYEAGDDGMSVGFLSDLDSSPEKTSKWDGYHDDPVEIVKYECEIIGSPITVSPALKKMFAVIDVDTKYSPKIKMMSLSSGNVGVMKVLKKDFAAKPLSAGMVLRLDAWRPKEAWGKPGVMENWIEKYTII